jgi:3'-5' exoribonuclease
MVLSHHNQPDYGSPVPPETREALALAMIDDFDAKMNILDKAYQGVVPGEWTQKVFTIDDRYFYLPLYTKDAK